MRRNEQKKKMAPRVSARVSARNLASVPGTGVVAWWLCTVGDVMATGMGRRADAPNAARNLIICKNKLGAVAAASAAHSPQTSSVQRPLSLANASRQEMQMGQGDFFFAKATTNQWHKGGGRGKGQITPALFWFFSHPWVRRLFRTSSGPRPGPLQSGASQPCMRSRRP